MIIPSSPRLRLSFILWLVSIHSFLVGIGLIIQIPAVMILFGFDSSYERFFPAQGGVFHIVMGIGYALAATDSNRFRCLVMFAILVKSAATVFLFTYYFIVESIWSILISGIVDGIMAFAIYFSWLFFKEK